MPDLFNKDIVASHSELDKDNKQLVGWSGDWDDFITTFPEDFNISAKINNILAVR
jgi:predicted dinucleotide-utilizing enzyme